jgi:hypothetical protein
MILGGKIMDRQIGQPTYTQKNVTPRPKPLGLELLHTALQLHELRLAARVTNPQSERRRAPHGVGP